MIECTVHGYSANIISAHGITIPKVSTYEICDLPAVMERFRVSMYIFLPHVNPLLDFSFSTIKHITVSQAFILLLGPFIELPCRSTVQLLTYHNLVS